MDNLKECTKGFVHRIAMRLGTMIGASLGATALFEPVLADQIGLGIAAVLMIGADGISERFFGKS